MAHTHTHTHTHSFVPSLPIWRQGAEVRTSPLQQDPMPSAPQTSSSCLHVLRAGHTNKLCNDRHLTHMQSTIDINILYTCKHHHGYCRCIHYSCVNRQSINNLHTSSRSKFEHHWVYHCSATTTLCNVQQSPSLSWLVRPPLYRGSLGPLSIVAR